MARPRSKTRRHWPDYLQQRQNKDGRVFYTYEGPAAPKAVYLGLVLDDAIKAVRLVNAKRASDPVQALLNRIEQRGATVADHVAYFKTFLEEKRNKRGRPLAPKTLLEEKRVMDDIEKRLGGAKPIDAVTTADVAGILDCGFGRWMRRRYRRLLREFFHHAVAKGHRGDNPAEATIHLTPTVDRMRLPWENYQKIYEQAEPWLRRAMDLALWSLQRENDLVQLRGDEHWVDGRLRLAQGKGQRHDTGRLAITPGPHLLAAIIACLNSPERSHRRHGECPYLLHRVPQSARKAKWKTHPMQIDTAMLSREFQRIRDEVLGLYDDVPMKKRPSFYEIKALGGDRYKTELKWTDEQVQALMAHTTANTTRHYLDGHGVRYEEVAAG